MLGECPAFGVPAVLVPYPYAWRYQKVNADYLARRGAGIRIADEEMPEKLEEVVIGLMLDWERLESMAEASANLDSPDSAEKLARLLHDVSQGAVK